MDISSQLTPDGPALGDGLTDLALNGNSTKAYVTRLLSGQASVIAITVSNGNRAVLSGADF